ncbi:MAG: CsbD family protein [Acidisphaera sp.]|nr:CsbD family protein [Acidisphaera sp.]
MSGNRFEGAARTAAGNVEEAAGRFTGDAKTQAQGKIDQAAGRLQDSYGALMDSACDAMDRLSTRTREQPLTTVLTAVIIGYLIGRIGRWI